MGLPLRGEGGLTVSGRQGHHGRPSFPDLARSEPGEVLESRGLGQINILSDLTDRPIGTLFLAGIGAPHPPGSSCAPCTGRAHFAARAGVPLGGRVTRVGWRRALSAVACRRGGVVMRATDQVRARGSLPAELTSFVGRRFECGQVKGFLAGGRLVTLTGMCGTGRRGWRCGWDREWAPTAGPRSTQHAPLRGNVRICR